MSQTARPKRQIRNKSVMVEFTEVEYLALTSHIQSLSYQIKLPDFIRKLTVNEVLSIMKKNNIGEV